MTARDQESALLARCLAVARQTIADAGDQREANIFRLAAFVLQSRFPEEAQRLLLASNAYFSGHPDEQLSAADVIHKGWVFSLPRLRDMLSTQLQRHP